MSINKTVKGLAIVSAMLFVTACGSSGGDKDNADSVKRPSVKELSTSIAKEPELAANLNTKGIDCVGQAFYDSKISNATLREAVKSDGAAFNSEQLPKTDEKALNAKEFSADLEKCIEDKDNLKTAMDHGGETDGTGDEGAEPEENN